MRLSITMDSPGNLLTIIYQLTKSEATSFNGFRDIFIASFLCPNVQSVITQEKMQRAMTCKKPFLKFSPGKLLLIFYQLSKFEAPSCKIMRYEVFYVQIFKGQ